MTERIRAFRRSDAAAVFRVFHTAVRIGAARHYTAAQRLAWAPAEEMPGSWPDWLAGMDTLVAEDGAGICGFMAAAHDGYLDMAFVMPDRMGRGLAQRLYDPLPGLARGRGLARMTAHASHFARPFLARNGWRTDHPETLERNGERLERFAMSIELEPLP